MKIPFATDNLTAPTTYVVSGGGGGCDGGGQLGRRLRGTLVPMGSDHLTGCFCFPATPAFRLVHSARFAKWLHSSYDWGTNYSNSNRGASKVKVKVQVEVKGKEREREKEKTRHPSRATKQAGGRG